MLDPSMRRDMGKNEARFLTGLRTLPSPFPSFFAYFFQEGKEIAYFCPLPPMIVICRYTIDTVVLYGPLILFAKWVDMVEENKKKIGQNYRKFNVDIYMTQKTFVSEMNSTRVSIRGQRKKTLQVFRGMNKQT